MPVNASERSISIVIAGSIFGFPNGHGASARICNYAAGLVKAGATVHVLCLKPSEIAGRPSPNAVSCGTYQGASFVYTSGTSMSSASRLKRYWLNLRGILGLVIELGRIRRQSGLDAILLYGPDVFPYTFVLWLLSRFHRCALIGEITEEPYVYRRPTAWTTIAKRLFYGLACKRFDGFIVISSHLARSIRPALRPGVPLLLLPVLVDTERFGYGDHAAAPAGPDKRLLYCGTLNRTEEVGLLIRAWARLANSWPEWKLHIAGDNSDLALQRTYSELGAGLGVTDSVVFDGLVSRTQLPGLLSRAAVMLLPRAAGLFSTAGLPNKLGEYLASGRPVIVTRVGDIGSYLVDGVSAYLVDPTGSKEGEGAFAKAMQHALANPSETAAVARAGRRVAKEHFDQTVNCERLVRLVRGLMRRTAEH